MSGNQAIHPYRDPAAVARWVCIVCYRSLSALSGKCPHCHVDRLELARADVREEVRQHAEKILYRRMMREELVLGGIAALVGFAIGFALWLVLLERYEDGLGRVPFFVGMGAGFVLRLVMLRAYVGLRPNAGIAVYALRRRRHAKALGFDATATREEPSDVNATADVSAASTVDPEAADLDQLLRWLGASLDG